jgi:hypothetical protein
MSEKADGEFIYRVSLRIDSDLGTRRQDSAEANSGITFIEANTGDHGKINILLSADSFTAGKNRCRLEIFSKRPAENDTLICSAEWTFRAAKNPTGENAGSVYPSLIDLENELEQLKTDTTSAKDAANDAAGALNAMLADIDNEPTSGSNHLVKSGGVYSFVNDKVQEAADDVRAQIPMGATANPLMDGTAAKGESPKYARQDHVHPHDTSKQDVLTFDNAPTAGSNNPVKSGGIKTAIEAASKRNVYYVKHAASTWQTSGSGVMTYEASTEATKDELQAIAAESVFVTLVPSPDGGFDIPLYEVLRDSDSEIIYLRSEIIEHSYTINASIDFSGTPTIECAKIADESPLLLHVEDITQSGGYNYVTFRTGEPTLIYDGRYTRDMHICLRVRDDVTFASSCVLRKNVVKEQDQGSVHLTSVSFDCVAGNSSLNITVYYRDGVYYTTVYTRT